MNDQSIGITTAPPTRCDTCGERFNRMNSAGLHYCGGNTTGFTPNERVLAGGAPGFVSTIRRGRVEVYFPASLRSWWFEPAELERVA